MSKLDSSVPSLAMWTASCKDCKNSQLTAPIVQTDDDRRQPVYEYSDIHAGRLVSRGQSRSDRCPECRKRHRKEIKAFPVAYVDVQAIGDAKKYVRAGQDGPTGPLGGLGPLPNTHVKRLEPGNSDSFAMGLTGKDVEGLIAMMEKNHVVILQAGTGTGKSTLVPFGLLNPPHNSAFRPTDNGLIVVSEPRVPATVEVARFVGETMCFGHDPKKCYPT